MTLSKNDIIDILTEIESLQSKYGEDFLLLLDLLEKVRNKDPQGTLGDLWTITEDILGNFGFGAAVPIAKLGIRGITKLISIISTSHDTEWTPEKVAARIGELITADDALDASFRIGR